MEMSHGHKTRSTWREGATSSASELHVVRMEPKREREAQQRPVCRCNAPRGASDAHK